MGVEEQTPLVEPIMTVEPAPPCRVPDWCFWPAVFLIIISIVIIRILMHGPGPTDTGIIAAAYWTTSNGTTAFVYATREAPSDRCCVVSNASAVVASAIHWIGPTSSQQWALDPSTGCTQVPTLKDGLYVIAARET
jgi:hypothetical protein